MENKKPIKRDPAIIEFSRDHHFGLLLVWKIRQGFRNSVDAGRISRYVIHFFEIDIIHHFNEEEELLFSKLPANDPLRVRAEKDHLDIKSIIKKIKSDPGNKEQLEKFAGALESHIRFEERELFNHLQDTVSAETLQQIASSVKPRNHEPDSAWDDVFWNMVK